MRYLVFLICLLIGVKSYSQTSNTELTGDILQIALPLSAALSTAIWNDDSKPVWQFVKSMGVSIVVTHSLKRIVNKERPNGGEYSFPSGHTAAAFTGAAFLDRRFGWRVGIPAYLLASFVGYSRVYSNNHDYWDVSAGAAIGIVSSYIFTKAYKSDNINMSWTKDDTSGAYLLGFVYKF